MLKPIPDLRQVGREQKPGASIVHVVDVAIGGRKVVIVAGPCSVETADQLLATALAVKNAGAVILRGGA
jgi:3-deoxy-7-phosphoheptulonate synthase